MMVRADQVIVALDILDVDHVLNLVDKLLPTGIRWFKVGVSLWTHAGREVVDAIKQRGGKVFLDLKFHDIPQTVARASMEATRLGVAMLNVHASGSSEMMLQTVAAVDRVCRTEKLRRLICSRSRFLPAYPRVTSRPSACAPRSRTRSFVWPRWPRRPAWMGWLLHRWRLVR